MCVIIPTGRSPGRGFCRERGLKEVIIGTWVSKECPIIQFAHEGAGFADSGRLESGGSCGLETWPEEAFRRKRIGAAQINPVISGPVCILAGYFRGVKYSIIPPCGSPDCGVGSGRCPGW